MNEGLSRTRPPELAADDLAQAMAEGATVVTPTRRLARALQGDFARHTQAASWLTPSVLPWSAWLQALFRELRDFGVLAQPRPCLDEWQSGALWEQALAADEVTQKLLMPGGAAESFREAWQLAHEWCLPWPELHARGGDDCHSFLRVAQSYQSRLDEMGCLDGSQLPALLAATLPEISGPPVIFAAFDRLSPAQQGLFEALGPRARRLAPIRREASPRLLSFPDGRLELTAAADWARRKLDEIPSARIAIVVPDLEAQAPMLEALLDEALAPQRLFPGNERTPRPWNLSLGRPLSEAPVIAAALLALGLARSDIELSELGRLLRSPFIGGAGAEGADRARLDSWLRERSGERVSRARLAGWLTGRGRAPACPLLAESLNAFTAELQASPRRRRPSEWAAAVTRALRALGWPGDTPMDSASWQTVQAWAELLDTFSRLDAVTSAMSLDEAERRLRRIATERRFQPETPPLPVQVLGLLETAGLEFDAIWVSGMHDGALPATLRPCALLPAPMQRERGMPRACPDRELEIARRLVARLGSAAPEVCFSYPENRDDEPLRPSPVIAQVPAAPARAPGGGGIAAAMFHSRRLESITDLQAPPVTGELRGGTGLLAAQSACPFKAFAVHRLNARAMETPGSGVDPATRGSFVHAALSELWASLRDSSALKGLDGVARKRAIRAALERAAAEHLADLPAGLAAIELHDAARRISELLDVEALRHDFEVIQREEAVSIELGPLKIRGRADRVDRVADGLVVIDYKTGQANPSSWDGERPAEPQMPLYAMVFRPQLAGLAYASLKPGAVGIQGRARSQASFGPALPQRSIVGEEAWTGTLDEWQRVLQALAGAFAAGDARVDPLRPLQAGGSCTWCHLATLCRRDELLRRGAIGHD